MSDYVSYNEMRNYGRESRERLTAANVTHTRHHSNIRLKGLENIPLILQLQQITTYRDSDSTQLLPKYTSTTLELLITCLLGFRCRFHKPVTSDF
jgi:hypothetical protein